MKKYIKSLFPYRWIAVFLMIIFTEFLILIAHKVAPFKLSILIVYINPLFWFIVDYFFGLGQPDLWDRNKPLDRGAVVHISSKGGNVSFQIGVQGFTLRPIKEETKKDTEQSVEFYKKMLKIAFENLGAEVEIIN